MHALITDNTVTQYPYTLTDLRTAHPNVSFPAFLDDADLAEWGVQPVQPTPKPDYGDTHRVTETTPVFADGQWHQAWTVEPIPQEELDAQQAARRAAMSVTRAQGKAALITAGLWPSVLAFVDGIEDETQRAIAEVALNDTLEWRRTSPFLSQAATALGVSDEQMDGLFAAAALIEL